MTSRNNKNLIEGHPTESDIIAGRGRGVFGQPGNHKFKLVIEDNLQRYSDAASKKEKMDIINSVYETMVSSGARFLKQETDGTWSHIGKKAARKKTARALRGFHARWTRSQSRTNSLDSVTATSTSSSLSGSDSILPPPARADSAPESIYRQTIRRSYSEPSVVLLNNFAAGRTREKKKRSVSCTGSTLIDRIEQPGVQQPLHVWLEKSSSDSSEEKNKKNNAPLKDDSSSPDITGKGPQQYDDVLPDFC